MSIDSITSGLTAVSAVRDTQPRSSAPTPDPKVAGETISATQSDAPVSIEEVRSSLGSLAEGLNAELLQLESSHPSRRLAFSVDDSSGRIVIQVMDRDTEAVVRQIPSEEALQLAKAFSADSAMVIDFYEGLT